MTSRDDFRSADDCPALSCLVMRDEVHSIYMSSVVADKNELRKVNCSAEEDKLESIEDDQRAVSWRQRCNVFCEISSSAAATKPNSCVLPISCTLSPSSSSLSKERQERVRSVVIHTTTNRASDGGGLLKLPGSVDANHDALKFHFVRADSLSGGTCSSQVSSTMFQIPECFSECLSTAVCANGTVPDLLPPDTMSRVSLLGTNLSAAREPTHPSAEVLQPPTVTDPLETFTDHTQPPTLHITENSTENATDVFDDNYEGKNLMTL